MAAFATIDAFEAVPNVVAFNDAEEARSEAARHVGEPPDDARPDNAGHGKWCRCDDCDPLGLKGQAW